MEVSTIGVPVTSTCAWEGALSILPFSGEGLYIYILHFPFSFFFFQYMHPLP